MNITVIEIKVTLLYWTGAFNWSIAHSRNRCKTFSVILNIWEKKSINLRYSDNRYRPKKICEERRFIDFPSKFSFGNHLEFNGHFDFCFLATNFFLHFSGLCVLKVSKNLRILKFLTNARASRKRCNKKRHNENGHHLEFLRKKIF
jgi:hypothetical protein